MEIHGHWKFLVGGKDILLVKVMDSWNVEAAIAFAQEFKDVASAMIGQPWSILISTEQADLMVPEAMTELEKLNSWAVDHNCKLEVSVVGYKLHEEVFKRTRADKESQYSQVSLPNVPEAVQYLSERGYQLQFEPEVVQEWFENK